MHNTTQFMGFSSHSNTAGAVCRVGECGIPPFFINILGDIRLLFKVFMRYCEPSQLRRIFYRGMHACLEFVRNLKKLLPKFVLKKKIKLFSAR